MTETRKDQIWLATLLAIVIPVLWLLPAGSSFWRDEAGTFWDVNHGLPAILGARWLGQSPLYYLTAWIGFLVGGNSEFALRVPSMLAMAGTAVLLYRIALRMFDQSVALLSVLVFVCLQHVAFAANDARPYAFALLAANTSMLLLLRWLDTGGYVRALMLAAGAAFVIYAHYFFGPLLLVEVAYALYRIRKGSPARIAELLVATGISILLVLPLTGHVLSLFHNRGHTTIPAHASFFDLLDAMAPATLIAPVALGLLIAFLATAWQPGRWKVPAADFWLIFSWAFFVPVLFFVVGLVSPLQLFISRYTLSGAPGFALLAAGVIGCLVEGQSRRIVAVSLAVGSLLLFGTWRLHGNEDWRGAIDAVHTVTAGSDTPILISSTVSEGSDPKTVTDPNLRNLFAPLEPYPLNGRLIRLPIVGDGKPTSIQWQNLEQVVESELRNHRRFVLLTGNESTIYGPWLMGHFSNQIDDVQDLGDFGNVSAVLFKLR